MTPKALQFQLVLSGSLPAILQVCQPNIAPDVMGGFAGNLGPKTSRHLGSHLTSALAQKFPAILGAFFAGSFAPKTSQHLNSHPYTPKCAVAADCCWIVPRAWCQNPKHIATQKYMPARRMATCVIGNPYSLSTQHEHQYTPVHLFWAQNKVTDPRACFPLPITPNHPHTHHLFIFPISVPPFHVAGPGSPGPQWFCSPAWAPPSPTKTQAGRPHHFFFVRLLFDGEHKTYILILRTYAQYI